MNFDDYESLPTQNPAIHMTAGALAGVMEHCVMYPLDSVKTRMQSLRTAAHRRTITATLRHMVQREGVLRPVRGMSAVVLGAGPAHACFFATYELAKRHLAHHSHDHLAHGMAGCLASLVHDAVSNPAEVVKQRLQMAESPWRGAWACARGVWAAEGARAFYRSYGAQVALSAPYSALHLAAYEWTTRRLNPLRRPDPRAHAAAGALAGALAAAATTPLDVCKTTLNTQRPRAHSLAAAARAVLAHGGPAAFLHGLTPRVLYHAPAAAICWLTYETFKHLLTQLELDETLPPAGPGVAGVTGVAGVSGGVAGVEGAVRACGALRLAAEGPLSRS